MHKAPPDLLELVRGATEALGYELVGVELLTRPKAGHLLRIYIDSGNGIGLADCEKVSHQVSGVLDVEDPIPGHYTLEVSSPGLDRLLFRPQDFERFAGQLVKVRLAYPIEGQRRFKGRLAGMRGENVVIEEDELEISLPFDQIEQARLVPEY